MSAATALAVFVMVGSSAGTAAPANRTQDIAARSVAHAAAGGNLVVNGKFENGTSGWRTKGKRPQRLTWTNPGHNSHGAARLTSPSRGKVVLDDKVNSVASARKGQVFKARVWVRARKAGLSGQLRLRAVLNGNRVGVGRTHFRVGRSWERVTLSYKVTRGGASLDLNVVGRHVGSRQALMVDDIRLVSKSSGAAPGAHSGKALLGMSAPVQFWDQRVREVGRGLQARRLFFTGFGASLGKATEACHDGMYPVISFKTGSYTWAQVAAGNADAAL
jgi:hypothetical protein